MIFTTIKNNTVHYFKEIYAKHCTPVVLLLKEDLLEDENQMSFKDCFFILLSLLIPGYNLYLLFKILFGTSTKVNTTCMNMIRATMLVFVLGLSGITTYTAYSLSKQIDELNEMISTQKNSRNQDTNNSIQTNTDFNTVISYLWELRSDKSEYYNDGKLFFAIDNNVLTDAYNQNRQKIQAMDAYIAKDKRICVDQATDETGKDYTMVQVTLSKQACKDIINFSVDEVEKEAKEDPSSLDEFEPKDTKIL